MTMNQFVIDMRASPSESRPANSSMGSSRAPAGGAGATIRPSWPFLVNSGSGSDKQVLKTACAPSDFAS